MLIEGREFENVACYADRSNFDPECTECRWETEDNAMREMRREEEIRDLKARMASGKIDPEDVSFWMRPDGRVHVVYFAMHEQTLDILGISWQVATRTWVHVSGGRIDEPTAGLTIPQMDKLWDIAQELRGSSAYSADRYLQNFEYLAHRGF